MKSDLPLRVARWLVHRCLLPSDAARLLDALDEEYVRHIQGSRTWPGGKLWYWSQVLRSIPPLYRESRRREARMASGPAPPGSQLPAGSRRLGPGGLWVDLLHLFRMLRRTPLSAASAILTLALTLGVGTSILSVVDAALLEPLPFTNPEQLVVVGPRPNGDPLAVPRSTNYVVFETWREAGGPIADLEAFDPTNVTLTEVGAAARLSATDVTAGFLDLLGVKPVLGRLFDAEDVGQPVAVVSSAFWRGRLSADPAVLGREIVLDGQSHTIVGVLPRSFFFTLNLCEVWRPFPVAAQPGERERFPVRVVARLSGGATPPALIRRLSEEVRTRSSSTSVGAAPIVTITAGNSRETLWLLTGAAAVAILVAFSNLAALLIVRSIDRARELAVRSALGASPAEALRQLLLEALTLVGLGILGGVLLAITLTPVLGRLALEFSGLSLPIPVVSWRAIGLVAGCALVLATACGLFPAFTAARTRVGDVLHRGATPSVRHLAMRRFFVAGQVAMAFVLLVSLGQVGRSLLAILDVGPGFEPAGVVKLQVSLPSLSYDTRESVASFYSALQVTLEEQLGAGTVASVSEVPLTGDGGRSLIGVRSDEPVEEAALRTTGPGYFGVMRIPILAGRSFTLADDRTAPSRVVITESLAHRMFGAGQAVGATIWWDRQEQMAEVIGVVGDVKHRALDEPPLSTVYLSREQFPSASSILVVRSTRPDPVVIEAVEGAVAGLDRSIPVYRVETMGDVIAKSPGVPARRILTAAFAGAAVLAVLLSAIGLFGVLAHDVASRGPELAVRMALGAAPLHILTTTLSKGAVVVMSGLLLGVGLSAGAIHGLRGILLSTQRGDWLVAVFVAAVILIGTGLASVLPVALRAANSDPSIALRSG